MSFASFCRRCLSRSLIAAAALAAIPGSGYSQSPPPFVRQVEFQPLAAQARRVLEALEYLGEPFSSADKVALERATASPGDGSVESLQEILDARVLFAVHIDPSRRVHVAQGLAKPELVEGGWRQFLVKVANEAGVTDPLVA